uniref:phage tail protein n=1 Tax=Brochothrix campestris TaxID=2757 RepID=UPI003D816DBE
MSYLIVSDIERKFEEILIDIDYDTFSYEYDKNTSRSISFDVIRTPYNAFSFDLVGNESLIVYNGQHYIVKTSTVSMVSTGVLVKSVTAQHIMYEFQNHTVYDIVAGEKDYTLKEMLNIGFSGNSFGYTFEIKGTFSSVSISDLGDMNGVEFINAAIDNFGCIVFANNKKITFYDDDNFYNLSEKTLRYKYNTADVKVSTNTQELKTVVRAYGKKKDKQESTYAQNKTTDLSYNGVFVKTGTWYTEAVNAYYTADIDVKWNGDSLDFKLKKGDKGGLWDIYLDGKKIKTLSAYNKSSTTDTVNLTNNLSKGKHTIKCVFVGDDPEHPMPLVEKTKIVDGKKVKYKEKELSRGCVGTETATILVVNANTEGNNAYHAIATYKSPNVSMYGERMAKAVKSDSITDVDKLKAWAKTQIQDTPETELNVAYNGDENVSEKDTLYFIHEPLGFSTDLKTVKIVKGHEFSHKQVDLSFSNTKKDIVSIQRSIANKVKQTSNKVSNTFNSITNIQQIADDAYSNILVTEYVGSVEDD